MTFGLRARTIRITMTGAASTPFTTTPIQRLDRVDWSEVQADTAKTGEAEHGVERDSFLRFAGEAHLPAAAFSDCISCRSRKDWDGNTIDDHYELHCKATDRVGENTSEQTDGPRGSLCRAVF